MLTLYDYLISGNGYKVRLLLTQLGVPFKRVELDITKGETRTSGFTSKFPNGRIPAVEFDDGRLLFESNAICWYFAEGTHFMPEDRFARARMLQWMFFEQYSHEPYIAVARFFAMHPEHHDPRRADLARIMKLGYDALAVMESHLKTREWFVDDRYSLADIALYAYTHAAHEGGFDLAPYPAVHAWLDRVRAQPKHVPITQA
ncbi:MAG TPA: glutathione S-transferase family protein [Candidatus Binataceae bacterium]|nr:glutathione S-transferase family protein [Candidatus Binataceae bacterium]